MVFQSGILNFIAMNRRALIIYRAIVLCEVDQRFRRIVCDNRLKNVPDDECVLSKVDSFLETAKQYGVCVFNVRYIMTIFKIRCGVITFIDIPRRLHLRMSEKTQ